MAKPSPCRPRTLAHEGCIRIDLCPCGEVHVNIGPVTLRLAVALVRSLSNSLQCAVSRLDDHLRAAMH
ncbi:MAG: hypothetical protein AB7V27_12365 [Candidatus Binatia bacterium]